VFPKYLDNSIVKNLLSINWPLPSGLMERPVSDKVLIMESGKQLFVGMLTANTSVFWKRKCEKDKNLCDWHNALMTSQQNWTLHEHKLKPDFLLYVECQHHPPQGKETELNDATKQLSACARSEVIPSKHS